MNLLYLGYWGLNDGLTQATILPNLELLLDAPNISRVVFVTVERSGNTDVDKIPLLKHPKIVYRPLESKNFPVNMINKVNDFILFPARLKSLLTDYQITKVIARGAPAGALIYKLCQKKRIPLFVESFEPHADYMLESGVWSAGNPKYIFEKKWEQKIKVIADGLMPVAENYRNQLISEGISPEKIYTVPCSVSLSQFQFNQDNRASVRKELNISEAAFVGIYVGKFGGIYYDEEAFRLFQRLYKVNADLQLIILTPDEPEKIKQRITEFGLPAHQILVMSAPHKKVPSYLSAADFGLAPIRPAPSRRYCSAIKVGEYWANGLPVLITQDVGDDSNIIAQHGAGWVLDSDWLERPDSYFEAVVEKLKSVDRSTIEGLAQKFRSFEYCVKAYQFFHII